MPHCPHKDSRLCPLYVAAHGLRNYAVRGETDGPISCDDGRSGPDKGCAVTRGLDYAATLARLQHLAPDLVAECLESERAEAARQKRFRDRAGSSLH